MNATITAEPPVKTVFMSRSPNQVLTRIPVRHVPDGFGGKKALSYAEWIAEEEALNRQRELKDEPTLPTDDTPWKVEFHNSEYSVPDRIGGHVVSEEGKARIVEWLRAHEGYENPGPSGFWELGKAPDEPKPTTAEQMIEIADAGASGDIERLEAVLQLERDTHNREAILIAAETGIARLRQFDPESGTEAETNEASDESRSGTD